MDKKRTALFCFLFLTVAPLCSQTVRLTLDSCRSLAVKSNTNFKISNEKLEEAEAVRRFALVQFFPKATANGVFFHNEKNIYLANGDQQNALTSFGDGIVNKINQDVPSWLPDAWQQDINSFLNSYVGTPINNVGYDIVDALSLDISNVWAGAVTVYQPVYMGGKIRAMYRSAEALKNISELQYDKARQDLLISVDEAYWRVISLQNKQALAQQFSDLLDTLSNNVQLMVDAEVATQGDLAKVRVKLNEAKMTLTKASSGLALSKMLLLQLCGLPFSDEYVFDDPVDLVNKEAFDTINIQEVYDARNEIRQLQQVGNIADAAVTVARSALLPNLLAQGSYVVSNPSLFNGFQNRFDGMYTIGAVLNIPICHPGGFYALKAAKHRRNQVQMQMQDAQEKISLQVHKLNYELKVANSKMEQAASNVEQADQNLTLAQESFAAGMISSSDLLQAHTAWMQAKSEQLDAAIEVKMSHLYLLQALGRNVAE